jgi:hypothetical protein
VQVDFVDGQRTTPVSDFYLEVGKGDARRHSVVHKFGAADDVGTGWTVIASAKTYATPTTATALEVVSDDNTNDVIAGSGARKVIVQGLDANWGQIQEEVTLTGTTAAALTNTYTRVFRMWVSESGTYATDSAASHNSTITLRVASAGATWAQINSESGFGYGQSLIGAYTIPAGKVGYIVSLNATVESNKTATLAFFRRSHADNVDAGYTGTMRVQQLYRGVSDGIATDFRVPLNGFHGPCDLGFFGKFHSGVGDIAVDFELILVDQ